MRVSWVDNAKALCILLVVIGHSKGLDEWVYRCIYSFHMPAFFFLSGYVLSRYRLETGFLDFSKYQFKRLIIPYVFFWIASYMFWLPTHQHMVQRSAGFKSLSFYAPFWGFFYGTANYLYPNVELWFFTCLFVTTAMFYVLHHYVFRGHWLPLLSVSGVAGLLTAYAFDGGGIRFPWNIDVSIVALVFLNLGFVVREYGIVGNIFLKSRKLTLSAFVVLSVILFLVGNGNGAISMSSMTYHKPMLFLLSSLLGIACLISVSTLIPRNNCFEWLSRNTIVIFPLHTIFFSVFTGAGVLLFKQQYDFKEQPLFVALYVLVSILLCVPVSHWIRRFVPALIGSKP